MKKVIMLLSVLFVLSCEKEDNYIEPLNDISACGYSDPINQLTWLNEIANKATTDNSGNYLGSIWIVKQGKTDCIITDMAFGSGGIYHYYFDCSGNALTLEELDFDQIEKSLVDSNMIFSTVYKK